MTRVVITGIGAITPIGQSLADIEISLYGGISGTKKIEEYNTIHGTVDCAFDNILTPSEAALTDRITKLSYASYLNAKKDSGIVPEGVFYGVAYGGATTIEECYNAFSKNKKISPYSLIKAMPSSGGSFICMKENIKGPLLSFTSACSSSSVALGEAYQKIKSGMLTTAAVVGSEAFNTYLNSVWWRAIGAINEHDTDPATAVRPFDEGRKGTAISEGSVCFMLESLESALERGANIYGEIVGYSITTGTETFTKPSTEAQILAINNILKQINIDDISYINAHATGTPVGDISEATAISATFGNKAKNIPVSSTKSLTGHLMGAAGAMETLSCIIALRNNKVIPNYFLNKRDDNIPDCINLPTEAEEREMDIALNNSFAFGGCNVVLALRKWK